MQSSTRWLLCDQLEIYHLFYLCRSEEDAADSPGSEIQMVCLVAALQQLCNKNGISIINESFGKLI